MTHSNAGRAMAGKMLAELSNRGGDAMAMFGSTRAVGQGRPHRAFLLALAVAGLLLVPVAWTGARAADDPLSAADKAAILADNARKVCKLAQ